MFLTRCQWDAGMDKLSGQRKATPLGEALVGENYISNDSRQITQCRSTYVIAANSTFYLKANNAE